MIIRNQDFICNIYIYICNKKCRGQKADLSLFFRTQEFEVNAKVLHKEHWLVRRLHPYPPPHPD